MNLVKFTLSRAQYYCLKSQVRTCFYNAYRRPPREIPYSRFEMIKMGWKNLPHELKLLKEEALAKFRNDIPIYFPGDVDMVFKFDDKSILDKFMVITDRDHNAGYSSGSLTLTQNGTGLFSGTLDSRVPKDGIIKRAGFVALASLTKRKSFQREDTYDWSVFTHLVIKCRGDGRAYMVNLSLFAEFDASWNVLWQYPLYTRGGPYWQYTKIPFSKFFLANKGRIQDKQSRIRLIEVTKVGIMCGDKNDGPFQLEIDFIGCELDMRHLEYFAYESYEIPDSYVPG